MQSTVTPEGDFCFSAMAGEFPGAPSVDALWHLLAQGQIAPLNSMLPRWELDKASIYSATVGEKNRTYLDSAYCLSDSAATPSRYEGRQVAIGRKVLQALLAQLTAQGSVLIRERTALVVATSWSDESFSLPPHRLTPVCHRAMRPANKWRSWRWRWGWEGRRCPSIPPAVRSPTRSTWPRPWSTAGRRITLS